MICRNCGAQLSNNEQVCPICGSSLMIDAAEAGAGAQENVGMPQEVSPEAAMPQPVAFNEGVATAPVPPVAEKPKKDGKVLAIILAMAAVVVIGVGVVLALSGAPTAKPENNQVEVAEEPTSVSYSGYQFAIPAGYKTSVNSNLGFVLQDDSMMYTVLTDYTNNYEVYKTAFLGAPETANPTVLQSGEKEYVVASLTGPDGEHGVQYMTASEDGSVTFVGVIVQVDYQLEEVKGVPAVLDQLLSSAKVVEDEGEKEFIEDAGTAGFVNYLNTFSNRTFIFGTEEVEEESE